MKSFFVCIMYEFTTTSVQRPKMKWATIRISSDRDDGRIFMGLKFLFSGFFWIEKFWQLCFWVV